MATRSGGSRSGSKSRSSSSSRSSAKRTSTKRSSASRASSADAGRADKSVEAFRDALERSVTLSRDRLQDVVDDAVKRGRITRDDANELVSSLLTRSRRPNRALPHPSPGNPSLPRRARQAAGAPARSGPARDRHAYRPGSPPRHG